MRIAAETLFFFILLYFIFGYPHDFALSEDRGFIFVGLSIGRRRGERFGCRYNVHVYGLLSLPHHFASTTPKNMASPTKSSWAEASKVKQLDSHTYQVILRDDWCIGSGTPSSPPPAKLTHPVPHGGYVASCFLAVASAHLSTTLRAQRQPHTMALHLEFPRRTETGPATFAVKDVKLGRQTSTLHITLSQHGRDEVLGYLTQADLDAEAGVTFPTGWALEPPPRVMRDGRALGRGAGRAVGGADGHAVCAVPAGERAAALLLPAGGASSPRA